MNEHQLRQEAMQAARDTLDRISGRDSARSVFQPAVCFIETRVRRSDVPETAQLIPMSFSVASVLQSRGLREPVSLTHLKGLWWVAQVDAAFKHEVLEFGGAYCTVVASTDHLVHTYLNGYAEVLRGPFATEEEARQALATPASGRR